MPADVTGSSIYNQREADFEFRPGPIFANLLLADEINRAPPKTQAALLEAMQERQVTIEGETHPLEPPFLVLATQNPIEYEGTYPLPEAQLDRFMLRIGVGYPGARARVGDARAPARARPRTRSSSTGRRPADGCWRCSGRSSRCTSRRASATTSSTWSSRRASAPGVQVGASPRGSLALLKLSRCRAALAGRDYVTPDDVKAVAVPALAHRLSLRPELWVERARARRRHRAASCSTSVPTPPVERPRREPDAGERSDPRGDGEAPRLPGARRRRAVAALALGRPELAALAAPFAVLARRRARRSPKPPELRLLLELDRERQLEGRDVVVDARARGPSAPSSASSSSSGCRRRASTTEAPEPAADPARLRRAAASSSSRSAACTGARTSVGERPLARPGRLRPRFVRGSDRASRAPLKVYPRGETLQRLLRPLETQAFAGNQVAAQRGEGIEFADLRPFTYRRPRPARELARDGEARRAVGERDASRSATRTSSSSSTPSPRRGGQTPERSISASAAAAALADALPRREGPRRARRVRRRAELADRASSGTTQLYRIVDSLLDAEILLSYAWKDLDVIPPRTLPPRALVLALSPLLDERAVGALLDLRARGFDLAVIELSPFPFVTEGESETERLALSALAAPARGSALAVRGVSACRSSSGAKACRWKRSSRR